MRTADRFTAAAKGSSCAVFGRPVTGFRLCGVSILFTCACPMNFDVRSSGLHADNL